MYYGEYNPWKDEVFIVHGYEALAELLVQLGWDLMDRRTESLKAAVTAVLSAPERRSHPKMTSDTFWAEIGPVLSFIRGFLPCPLLYSARISTEAPGRPRFDFERAFYTHRVLVQCIKSAGKGGL